MRGSARELWIPGIVLTVLGALLFFVSEEIKVEVEFLPFSLILIFVLVVGSILFGIGILSFVADRFWEN